MHMDSVVVLTVLIAAIKQVNYFQHIPQLKPAQHLTSDRGSEQCLPHSPHSRGRSHCRNVRIA